MHGLWFEVDLRFEFVDPVWEKRSLLELNIIHPILYIVHPLLELGHELPVFIFGHLEGIPLWLRLGPKLVVIDELVLLDVDV